MKHLFRKEAIEEQSTRLFGEVSLAQPLSVKLTTGIILAFTFVLICFLLSASYTRKETVRGFLRPDKGLIKAYPNRGGILEELLVKEGEQVEKGSPLARIIIPQSSFSGEELSEKIMFELYLQIDLVDDATQQFKQAEQDKISRISKKITQSNKSYHNTISQKSLLEEKASLAREQIKHYANLQAKGFVPLVQYQIKLENELDVRRALESIKALEIEQLGTLEQLSFDLADAPQEYLLRSRELVRQRSEINQKLSRIENDHSYLVTASHGGIVSAVHVAEGQALSAGRPILTLLPQDTELVGVLLFPTRSAGLIALGDSAHVRFEAFPHQRFGALAGTISGIDQSLVSQKDVSFPIPFNESVYLIEAVLEEQFIKAYGQTFRLKSGMLFEADIVLESRSLVQWLLDPIYSLRGKLL
ncbi:MAG: membrane fusion protein [Candidatus Azotimanducaceae bacterium]